MGVTEDEDRRINSMLYKAMMEGEYAKVVEICAGIPKGPLHTLTIHGDTVIHMATYHGKTELALDLLDMVPVCDYHKLTWQNGGGNTILHETATNSRSVKAAQVMLSKAPMLLSMSNKSGETALFYAARHGKTKIFKFLHAQVTRATQGPDLKAFLHRGDKFNILHVAVLSRNYWIAHELATTHEELIGEVNADGMTALQILSISSPEFSPKSAIKRMIFKLIDPDIENERTMFPFLKKQRKEKHNCEWGMKLAKLLIRLDTSWERTELWMEKRRRSKLDASATDQQERKKVAAAGDEAYVDKPDTPLLLATIHGSTEIVKEILQVYPQAVEYVDKEGRNILHLAILYRRHQIIDVVQDMKYPFDRLRGKVDKRFNTLLHMVGLRVNKFEEDIKNSAQVLKEDTLLFERVRKICTVLDTMTRNVDLKTAQEVFNENNEKTRLEAKDWLTENSKNCSVVAVLIATVAYTTAYTIPGGSDEAGQPKLKNRTMFLIFTVADAISLSSALTSVIIFLNILTSPFQFEDFQTTLFRKQFIGLILLGISVAMMMVSFAATLILTISRGTTWTHLTLYIVSFFPVLVFLFSNAGQYSRLLRDFSAAALKKTRKATSSWFRSSKPSARRPIVGSIDLTTPSRV